MNITTKIEQKEIVYDSDIYCKNVGIGSYDNYNGSIHLPLMMTSTKGIGISYGGTLDRPSELTVPTIRFNTDSLNLELYHPRSDIWSSLGTNSEIPISEYAIEVRESLPGYPDYDFCLGLLKNIPSDIEVMSSIDLQSKRDYEYYIAGNYCVNIGTNLTTYQHCVAIGHNIISDYTLDNVIIGTTDITTDENTPYPIIGTYNDAKNGTNMIIGSRNTASDATLDYGKIIIGNNILSEDDDMILLGNRDNILKQLINNNKYLIYPSSDMSNFDNETLEEGKFVIGIDHQEKKFIVKSRINGEIKELNMVLEKKEQINMYAQYGKFVEGEYVIENMGEILSSNNYLLELEGTFHAGILLGADVGFVYRHSGNVTKSNIYGAETNGGAVLATSFCIFGYPPYDGENMNPEPLLNIGYKLDSYVYHGTGRCLYEKSIETTIPTKELFTDVPNTLKVERNGDTLTLTIVETGHTFSVTKADLFKDYEGNDVEFLKIASRNINISKYSYSSYGSTTFTTNFLACSNFDFSNLKIGLEGDYIYEFPLSGYTFTDNKATTLSIAGSAINNSPSGENLNYEIIKKSSNGEREEITLFDKKVCFKILDDADVLKADLDLIDYPDRLYRIVFSIKLDIDDFSSDQYYLLTYMPNMDEDGNPLIISYNPYKERLLMECGTVSQYETVHPDDIIGDFYSNLNIGFEFGYQYNKNRITTHFMLADHNIEDIRVVNDISPDHIEMYIASSNVPVQGIIPEGYVIGNTYIENIYYFTYDDEYYLDPMNMEKIDSNTYRKTINTGDVLDIHFSNVDMEQKYAGYPPWFG